MSKPNVVQIKTNDPSTEAFRITISKYDSQTLHGTERVPAMQSRVDFILSKEPVATAKPGEKRYYLSMQAYTLYGTVTYSHNKSQFIEHDLESFEDAKEMATALSLAYLKKCLNHDICAMHASLDMVKTMLNGITAGRESL